MSGDEWSKRCLLVEYGKKLLETGLVQGTWGNLSIRLDDEYMLVTPSGLDYNRLTPL
ncbi:MAG: class II aldolase/adducin family protein, partial [Clostridiales bacterium]|nr:class II aldolase/adducin family protein [Clostridiales bacterium]